MGREDTTMSKIIQGDALTELKKLKEESVNCVVTSPPYWALRDYGVEGQLGLEPTFQEYINKLCDIFDEVRRVLKKDGTCWVNLGDTYASGGGKAVEQSAKRQAAINTDSYPNYAPNSKLRTTMPKCLLQIPFRFSIEMCNRGWILRNVIIWHKPNCMPSSVKDRFTVDFEYVFFFVKNKKYWFERQFESILFDSIKRERRGSNTNKYTKDEHLPNGVCAPTMSQPRKYKGYNGIEEEYKKRSGRNKRCVWKITRKPFKEAHFAVFPEELVETPIKAGCPSKGIVLDPFMGSGTTGVVAKKLNRDFIGIELNPEYIKMAEKRIKNTQANMF